MRTGALRETTAGASMGVLGGSGTPSCADAYFSVISVVPGLPASLKDRVPSFAGVPAFEDVVMPWFGLCTNESNSLML